MNVIISFVKIIVFVDKVRLSEMVQSEGCVRKYKQKSLNELRFKH